MELFDKVINSVTLRKSTQAFFSQKSYIPILFDTRNFHPISPSQNRDIAFIDGGNIEIIGNNNFSFQLMRIYCAVYKDNKRVSTDRQDYFVLVNTSKDSDNMVYISEVYQDGRQIQRLVLPFEVSGERQKPEVAVGITRRMLEISRAETLTESLDAGSIITMDGSLIAKSRYEHKAMSKAMDASKNKGIGLCGLCKTSSILTDSGDNIVGYLHNIAPDGSWYYLPICDNQNKIHNADMVVAKLHPKAEFSFLVEISKDSKQMTGTILHNLSLISKDPVFLGYPYGLIEADKMARCQKEEAEFLKIKIMMHAKKNEKALKNLINTNKAHSILDNIG